MTCWFGDKYKNCTQKPTQTARLAYNLKPTQTARLVYNLKPTETARLAYNLKPTPAKMKYFLGGSVIT